MISLTAYNILSICKRSFIFVLLFPKTVCLFPCSSIDGTGRIFSLCLGQDSNPRQRVTPLWGTFERALCRLSYRDSDTKSRFITWTPRASKIDSSSLLPLFIIELAFVLTKERKKSRQFFSKIEIFLFFKEPFLGFVCHRGLDAATFGGLDISEKRHFAIHCFRARFTAIRPD